MKNKVVFLQLIEKVLSGVNAKKLELNADEEKMLNYINGIAVYAKQNSSLKPELVLKEFQLIYSFLDIELLSKEMTLMIVRKCKTNHLLAECMSFVYEKVKHKKLTRQTDFWELFLESIVLYYKDSFTSIKPKLLVLIKFCNLFCGSTEIRECKVIFRFLLNHYSDGLKTICGNNFLPFMLKPNQFNETRRLFELLLHFKKAKAEIKLIQEFFILFANYDKETFIYIPEFSNLLQYLLRNFDSEHLMTLQREDYSKLFFIFKLNSTLFEKLNVECVLQDDFSLSSIKYNKQLNFSDKIIRCIFIQFRISYFFFNNYLINYPLYEPQSSWFRDVVSGKNLVYSKDIPFTLSKKIVHKFNTVDIEWEQEARLQEYTFYPDWFDSICSLTVREGLVWSAIMFEVKNVPYTTKVTQCIAHKGNLDFWTKVIVQLYKNEFTDNDITSELIDYIDYQVFRLRRDINFKHKKKHNLLEESHQWHVEIANKAFDKGERFIKLPSSDIQPFYIQTNETKYVIRQLKTNYELNSEGYVLRHCVGTYDYQCIKNGSFIFSLRKILANKKEQSLITIEVNQNRIIQKRGKYNRVCLEFEEEIIQQWAKENKLQLEKD